MQVDTTRATAADVTLQQMGGANRLRAMIGAHDFAFDHHGATLHFKFRGCRKANCVKVTLNGRDLYDLRFLKIGRLNKKTWEVPVDVTGEFSDVHVEQLRETFEQFTGLFLSLT